MPKAINSRALTNQKPCINMEFHVPLKHKFILFICKIQGNTPSIKKKCQVCSRSYRLNGLRKSYADSDIVKKMTERATLNENVRKMI